mmetsp:Transcript_38038/g.118151  ORF Transcript_38038/g.118151 Transcript_38038/m.118151 type:complete len:467 (+) Transcript_38038:3-1403(+)
MECCEGGELYYELTSKGRFSEPGSAQAAWQMLSAVGYLHAHAVVHRDLKLENFLYSGKDKAALKLIDFGFAKVWDGDAKMLAACGTPDYVGPEVLGREGYTSKCDLWSLGVIVFMLLSGRAPLHAERREQLQRKIKRGEVDWSQLWQRCVVSAEAADFLQSLLVRDPEKRMDAQTAMFHPWLIRAKAAQGEGVARLTAGVFSSLRRYGRSPPLRRAVLQLISQQLSPEEAQELTALFLALVEGCEGTIVLERLRGTIEREGGSARSRYEDTSLALAEAASVDRLFRVLDVRRDGQVHYTDFLAAAMGSQAWPCEEALRAAFGRFDGGRSGAAQAADLRALFGDDFEGADAEALLVDLERYGCGRGDGMDFEAFMRVVHGVEADVGESDGERFGEDPAWPPEPPPPSLFPAPKSPPKSPLRQRPAAAKQGHLLSPEGPMVEPWALGPPSLHYMESAGPLCVIGDSPP